MTTIDTSSAAATSEPSDDALSRAAGTVAGWLTTTDHKRIGRLFAAGGLAGLLATAATGLVLGIERVDGGQTVLDAGALPQLFQAFRVGLVFAVMLPLVLGVAIAVVPLQLGARALAFPRAAMAAFYTWLAGLVLVVVALANNGGIGGGDDDMVDLFLAAHGLMAVGIATAAGCLATSVLTTRAPGMTMRRVPMFSWSVLVMAIGLVLMMPVLVGAVIYLFVDHRLGSRQAFDGNAGIGDWVGWVFTQPATYLMALPALGLAAEILPVTFRKRQPMRLVLFSGLALVGVGALGAVTQVNLFALPWSGGGLDLDDFGDKFVDLVPYAIFYLLPLLGAVIVLAVGGLAAVGGRPRITAPFLFSFFGLGMVLVGMAGMVLYPIVDLGLLGTVYEEAVVVYLAYGVVLAALGGLTFWAPKLWGRELPGGAVMPLALLGVLATVLASFPYFIAGFADQPASSPVYDYSGPAELWNVLVLVGHALMALTVLAWIGLAAKTFTGDGDAADDDPWGGQTLEWLTSSPAPHDNFAEVPTVASPEPALDVRGADDDGGAS